MRIAITPGEPAGIGPDLVIDLAQEEQDFALIACADPEMLQRRAHELGKSLSIEVYDAAADNSQTPAGTLKVVPHALQTPATAGKLNALNARYVLDTLTTATDGCLDGRFDAVLTAPVHKGVINEAGIAFTGHTEFLADRCGVEQPVMLLCTDKLRVALLTTHLALTEVPAAVTAERIDRITRIIATDMERLFGVEAPRISVLGLNPHAGEGGHLGREELHTIIPALDKLRGAGIRLTGPLPADSAFTHALMQETDVYLAMYHDQGLPVLKFAGFGEAVNVTLGLPIVRTSVDHGTALELAGTGRASAGSLLSALRLARQFAARRPA